MKTFINISLTFVFLPCILAGCANAQKVDLATNEAVIAELQKRADAKRTELGKTGGSKLSAKSVCIERLKESEKVIVIGFFAYDRGCRHISTVAILCPIDVRRFCRPKYSVRSPVAEDHRHSFPRMRVG